MPTGAHDPTTLLATEILMPKICYVPKKFQPQTVRIIQHAMDIVERYAAQGYDLTVRQVYYQMIAKDFFPESWIDEVYNRKQGLDPRTKNTMKNYKKFGGVISDARRAGLIDWDAIVDRRRGMKSFGHWDSPAHIIHSAALGYRIDKWADQPKRVEVWVEKDALIGVVERACAKLQLPHFSCAGYNSDSEMWRAAQRLRAYKKGGQDPVIIQLSDHDPSGKDMERDVVDRLYLYSGGYNIEVNRIALTMEQIEQFDPPPNPAKDADPRAAKYVEEFGDSSWELDAMEPAYLNELIDTTVRDQYLELDAWEAAEEKEETERQDLVVVSASWPQVVRETKTRELIRPCVVHFTSPVVRQKDRTWGCETCNQPVGVETVMD